MTSALTAREREVVAEVGRRERDLVALLSALIGFDTRVPEADQAPREEAALQAFVAERLEANGMAVRVWEPDSAALRPTRHPHPPDHSFAGRPQLVARRPGTGAGRSLLLNGHVDVVGVEPRAAWTTAPLAATVRDGRVYGRGACDMKGGVAAMLVAAETLCALGVPLRGDLLVNTVTDEESTGLGSLACARDGVAADGGVIPEPTGLRVWLGTRGSLLATITVEGRAGHAGYPYEPGAAGAAVNAIEKMQVVLAALERVRAEWQARPELRHPHLATGSIVPTGLEAGEWLVAYPARCTLDCHVQYLPAQADAEGWGTRVEAELEARVAAAAAQDPWLARHPPRFRWAGDVPPAVHAPDEPVAAAVLDAMAAVGLAPEISRRTTFFDGPTFSRAGTPTVAFGPGDVGRAHAPDEFVPIAELVRAAQVLAVLAMRFCGVDEEPSRRRARPTGMRPAVPIESHRGERIATLEEWRDRAPPTSPRHWREHRSAYELARAWTTGDAPQRLEALLGTRAELAGARLERAVAERKSWFDDIPGAPRNHDLLAIARAEAGTVVVGVEAKADETFDRDLAAFRVAALRRPGSRAPERLDRLTRAFFGVTLDEDPSLAPLRYQLLAALAGTLAEAALHGAIAAVLVVHEFVTPATDALKQRRNAADLAAFVSRLAAAAPRSGADHLGAPAGPFAVPGNAHLPSDVPIYVGKLVTHVSAGDARRRAEPSGPR